MGKFKEALGVGEFNIAGLKFDVVPDMLECEAFTKIRKLVELDKDDEAFKKNNELVFLMLARSQSSLTDEDKQELKQLIALNQREVLEENSILFKWTTREERQRLKDSIMRMIENGDILKNLSKG